MNTRKRVFFNNQRHIIAKSLLIQSILLIALKEPTVSDGQQEPQSQQQGQSAFLQQQQQEQQQQQQQQQLQPSPLPAQLQQAFQAVSQRPEMLISFEQTPQVPGNPTAALASSQVMKLCSCSCQTMTPAWVPPPVPMPTPSPRPTREPPFTGPIETVSPSAPPPTQPETEPPPPSSPSEPSSQQPSTEPITSAGNTTTTPATTTTTTSSPLPAPSSEPPPETTPAPTSTPQPPPVTTQGTSLSQVNACNSVEWVKPNMSVYSSSKVVWDVDRANQNYFLCNSLLDGELVPGKTHGFSCKLSSQGKALEMHNFNVLIKPETVNLAWVHKDSDTFGKTNLPVVGGHSKDKQEPYIISRCLIGDENNDVITLIGYVNNKGIGWFPFDDIQIECPQYDVLVCVNKF